MHPSHPPGGAGGQPPQPPPRPSRGQPPQPPPRPSRDRQPSGQPPQPAPRHSLGHPPDQPAQCQQAQAAGGSGAPQPTPLPPALSVTSQQISQQAQQQVQERVVQNLADGADQLDDMVEDLREIVRKGTTPGLGKSPKQRWEDGSLTHLWWILASTLAKLRLAHMDVQMSAQLGEFKVGGHKVEYLCRNAVRRGGEIPPLGTSESELLAGLHSLLNMLTDLQTAVHHRQGKK